MLRRQWNGGVERKANPLLRECWMFLIYIFLHQQWKQCLEFTLANWEKSAYIWLVLAIQTVMPMGYTILLLSAKQGRENQCNEASRLMKMYQKSSAFSICFEMRRSPFANWNHYIAAKKPQPLCETWNEKGIGEKRNCGHRLIMHSITRRGGGDVRRSEGGGAGGSFTQTYEPGEIVWQCT